MKSLPVNLNPWALFPLLAGLAWLQGGEGWRWVLVVLPGLLLAGSGVSMLLWPGDQRITRFMALGSLLGIVIGLFWWASSAISFTALLLSVVSFVVAGREALRAQIEMPGEAATTASDVPVPGLGPVISAKAALDEALLAYFVGTADLPGGERAKGVVRDMLDMHASIRERGLLDQPEGLHATPDAPDAVEWRKGGGQWLTGGREYGVLSFDSGFQADPGLPGAQRWMAHAGNRHTAAWVLRHEDGPRPWLVCVHGYRMGMPWLDFRLFPPAILHEKLGLNLLMPVLPLHGPRRSGLRSGDHYLDGEMTDLVHAESHALWDLRRHLAWLRKQEDAPRIGVIGFSLGGYNAALLSQYERDLDFVVAGIPVSDFASTLWSHLSPAERDYYEREGCSEALLRDCLRPVSPLAKPPLLARDRRFVFGGTADRLVAPAEVAKLARHWDVDTAWYEGGHLTFRGSGIVRDQVRAAMSAAGWEARPTSS